MVASWPFIAERKFDEAIGQLRQVTELDENFPMTHEWLAKCYEAKGSYPAAIQEFRTRDLIDGSDSNLVNAVYSKLQQAYNASGEQGYLRTCIELVNDERSLPDEGKLFGELDLAGCYARLGDKQKALDELEKHLDQMHHWELNFDPVYDSLHNEPRFHTLLKRAGLVK
jgi:tetratricopeptide (TPR) repeat protein